MFICILWSAWGSPENAAALYCLPSEPSSFHPLLYLLSYMYLKDYSTPFRRNFSNFAYTLLGIHCIRLDFFLTDRLVPLVSSLSDLLATQIWSRLIHLFNTKLRSLRWPPSLTVKTEFGPESVQCLKCELCFLLVLCYLPPRPRPRLHFLLQPPWLYLTVLLGATGTLHVLLLSPGECLPLFFTGSPPACPSALSSITASSENSSLICLLCQHPS